MRILLAYSGDLTTTVAIPWLREQYQAEVITATIDLGQDRELDAVRDRALAAGAIRAHVLDNRDQFARDFVLPSLKADALHGDQFVLAVALSEPLIARTLVEIAAIERADGVAHGASGREAEPVPLDVLIRSLNPGLQIVAVPSPQPRELVAYATARGLTAPSEHNVAANLWGRSVGCVCDDSRRHNNRHEAMDAAAPAVGVHMVINPLAECPDEPAVVEIAFDRGIPKAINGVCMPLVELIASLETIAGAHGVGRFTVDGRLCEAPAAVLLHTAHRQLQAEATGTDLQAFARAVSLKYVDLVCEGLWFTPLREALDAFVDKVQERVTGDVRLKLFKGSMVKH